MRWFAAFVLASLFFALGVSVIRAKPSDAVNRWFGLFTIAVAAWVGSICGLVAGVMLEVAGRIAFASASLIPAAFLGFTKVYPSWSRWPSGWTVFGALGLGIVLALIALATPLIVHDVQIAPDGLRRTPGLLHTLFSIYFLAVATMGLAVFLWKWNRALGIQRLHAQYLGFGLVVAAIGAVTSNLVVPWAYGVSNYSDIGPYFLLPLVMLIAHAIIRHRLFDLRVAIGRAAVFALFVLAPTVIVTIAADWMTEESGAVLVPVPLGAIVAVSIAALIASRPIALRLERIVDAYLFRGRPDLDKALNQAVRRMARALTEEQAFREIEEIIQATTAPEWTTVLRPGRDQPLGVRPTAWATVPPKGISAAAWEFASDAPLVRHITTQSPNAPNFNHAEARLSAAGTEIWVSLGRPGAISAIILLGRRSDGRPYFTPVVEFLQGLADVASVVVETLQFHSRQVELERDRQRLDNLARMGRAYAELAHEIRTPLTTISNLISALPDRVGDEEYRQLLTSLVPAEIARITGLAEQLREFSSDSAPQREVVRLGTLLEDVARLAQASTDREVSITIDGLERDLAVTGERNRLVQLFVNLLSNAIEASPDRGTVTVRGRTVGDYALIEISDSGSGIKVEVEKTLFDPFVTTKAGGRGLGLAICLEIVRAHGGRLAVVNRSDDVGARAEVALPLHGVTPEAD
jgi:signal transduction histidine kinase